MVFRRRALMRGAMVGGAAYYAGRRVSQNESREYEQQQRIDMLEAQQARGAYAAPAPPQYAPPPPAPGQKSTAEEITELKQLMDSGVLTQQEFETAKAKILRS